MPRSLLVFRQCCGAFLFMLFWFRGGLLKIVLVKSLFFGRNGLGRLGLGAVFQTGDKLLCRDAALLWRKIRCRMAVRQVGTKGRHKEELAHNKDQGDGSHAEQVFQCGVVAHYQMAGNGKKFAHIARMHAPDAEFLTPEQAKLFGGNVYNPGEFVFCFILVGLMPVAAALFLLHLDRAVSPKDLYQETCTVTSYQFTENDDGDKRLELELPGYTAAFYTWGIEPDSAKMAQIEQEIADKVTFTVSFPKNDQNKKDLIPIIQLESADHVYLSLADYNHDTLKARNELILLSGGFEVLWLLFVLTFSYVVRHADKHPKLVRLFVKPSYLIDKSDMK